MSPRYAASAHGARCLACRQRDRYRRAAMQIKAATPEAYLDAIPEERRPHIEKLRKLVKKAVPKAKEGVVWGMLGYEIDGRPFVCVASQKNYMSLYLCDLYTAPELRKKHEKALSGLK